MTTNAQVIRFPFQLRRADLDAIRRLEAETKDQVIRGRIGPEGERQVRTASGEIYNVDSLHGDDDPLPPAPAMALLAA